MEPKRRRVSDHDLLKVVHMRGVSGSALQRVINALTDSNVSGRSITTASRHRFEQVKHTMRLPGVDGGEVAFDICEPKALLAMILKENNHVCRYYEEAWRRSPCSASTPWRLLVGWDEFTPGNKMAVKPTRKTMTLSFSFVELRDHIHLDGAWVTPLAIRAKVLSKVKRGGLRFCGHSFD